MGFGKSPVGGAAWEVGQSQAVALRVTSDTGMTCPRQLTSPTTTPLSISRCATYSTESLNSAGFTTFEQVLASGFSIEDGSALVLG